MVEPDSVPVSDPCSADPCSPETGYCLHLFLLLSRGHKNYDVIW